MKLFSSLSPLDQEKAVEFCLKIMIEDILTNGFSIKSQDENDLAVEEHLNYLLEECAEMASVDEKVKFLMEDEIAKKTILDSAVELAKSAYFHNDDELVVFKSDLYDSDDLDCAHLDEDHEGEDVFKNDKSDGSSKEKVKASSSSSSAETPKDKKFLN